MPELAGLWEFRAQATEGLDVGGELTVEQFTAGQQVDVQGVSKGRVTPGPLSAGISVVKSTPTVTRSTTVTPDQLAYARPQVECSKAKRCLARWVMCV